MQPMSALFVPTRFVWPYGGQQVFLCGSFTRWVETVPMAPVSKGSPGLFAVMVHLPPGYHQYKFVVDGEWRHDDTQPFMPDPLGNVNNWIFVQRPEPVSGSLPGVPLHIPSSTPHTHASVAPSPAALTRPDVLQSSTLASRSSQSSVDVDMACAEGVVTPIALLDDEPQHTRRKIKEFLQSHTAYELIPESGKVVLMDMDFPVRQAFHALHEQGVASAPLWDSQEMTVPGMISASDFITTLKRLRSSISSGANPLSEAEMDAHTIRLMRDEACMEGRELKSLVYCKPSDSLAVVVRKLIDGRCSVAPVLSCDPSGSEQVPNVLHIASVSGVLSCLMRHFRASLASLPLLSQPLSSLPLGTWAPHTHAPQPEAEAPGGAGRRMRPLHCVQPHTPLTTALSMLLETGVSCLPVVGGQGALVDIYARADITLLAKGNAYSRLQWEDVTVGQALLLASSDPQAWAQPADARQHRLPPPPAQADTGLDNSSGKDRNAGGASPRGGAAAPPMGALSHALQAAGLAGSSVPAAGTSDAIHQQYEHHGAGGAAHGKSNRVYICTRNDSLRTVVERLSMNGVRRLIIIEPETRQVEGILSLSDVASYLLCS